MIDLDKLETLARAATPGEWLASVEYAEVRNMDGYVVADCGSRLSHRATNEQHAADIRDAAFIAAASPDVALELAAELRLLRAVAEAAREVVELYAFSPPGSCVRALDASLAALVSP